MAWTAPKTWLAAVLSVADMNTHVRDNLLETVPAKASAAGQVPYANGVNSIAMLSAVARRMPRFNAAGNALETVANLSLAQAPIFASNLTVNLAAHPTLTDINAQAITTTGGLVIVVCAFRVSEVKNQNTMLWIHHYRLRRDTTDLIADTMYSEATNGAAATAVITPGFAVFMDAPAAGTYTYRLALSYEAAGTSGTPTGDSRMLLAELAA